MDNGTINLFIPIAIKKVNDNMETKYYIVARIDGDYAWLKRMDAEEEPLYIARALLPEEIDEGTKLKYEMLQYEIIEQGVTL